MLGKLPPALYALPPPPTATVSFARETHYSADFNFSNCVRPGCLRRLGVYQEGRR